MKTNGIILAAGLSSRMKAFKPLLKLKGKTIIENTIDSMFYAGVDQVSLVLGYRGREVEAKLHGKYDRKRLLYIYNNEYAHTDMLTSVKIGIKSLNTCDAFYLLPGDMPAVNTKTFLNVKQVMEGSNAMVIFPTIDGYRKHPPLISWKCIDYILKFEGEGGLREVWKKLASKSETVPVEDVGCTLDADTPEDFNRLTEYMDDNATF